MKLAEILSGPERWMQGNYSDQFDRDGYVTGGRCCLVGALMRLHSSTYVECAAHPEYRRMRRAIQAATGEDPLALTYWNDEPGRTWDEIRAVVEAYDRDRLLHP